MLRMLTDKERTMPCRTSISTLLNIIYSICSVARQSESTKKAKVGRGINIPAWFGELPKIERHDESPNFSEGTVLDETRVMVNPRSCRDDSTCSPEASLVANEALLP